MKVFRDFHLHNFVLLAFELAFTGVACGFFNVSKIHVDPTTHGMTDSEGRLRIFHGLNRVQKGPPWYPSSLLDEQHLDNLQTWGFNVMRLGMMWSGVVVKPFVINTTYLVIMDGIIDSLGKRGIYVILDMHQDALSSKFGSYDGAPLWLMEEFPKPEHAYPWPFSAKPSQWGLNYVTGACGTAFDDLYKNQSRAVDHFKFFWQTVAKRFGGKDNVLGYELINEPWPGDVLSDPLLFLPGKAGSERLMPLYDKLALAIADVDKSTIIFYEPVTWGMIIHGKELGSGFTSVPGGDNFKHRAVFSFHYYCWFAGSYQVKVFPAWLRDLCDHLFFPDVVSAVSKNIQETGGGMFLTEFGLCNANAPHTSTLYEECLSVLQHSDAYSLSWTYWDSEFFFPNGSVNTDNVKLFSRPYPMAIAGRPVLSEFEANSGLFVFQFLPTAHKTTFLFLPAIHYPTGYKVSGAGTICTITGRPVVEVTCSTETIVTLQFLPQA